MTTFIFEQLTVSEPGFSINSSITVNGDLTNLPSINSHSLPIYFGNLISFYFAAPGMFGPPNQGPPFNQGTYTLAAFTQSNPFFPLWSISPDGISFIDRHDANAFSIQALNHSISTIYVNSDHPGDRFCFTTNSCFATGVCVQEVPE